MKLYKKALTSISLIVMLLVMLTINVFSVYQKGIRQDQVVETFDYSSLVSPTSIIDGSTPGKVSDPRAKPYNSLVSLETHYQSGKIGYLTGFMISPNCMLTAAHAFVNAELNNRGEIAQYVVARFGAYKDNGVIKYQESTTVSVDSGAVYFNPNYKGTINDCKYDYGYIVFDKDYGTKYGTIVVRAETNSGLTGLSISTAGFRGTTSMWMAQGKVESITDEPGMILHSASTEGGQSGSPVYNSDNKAVGIHVEGIKDGRVYNAAWRITADFLYELADLGYVTLA